MSIDVRDVEGHGNSNLHTGHNINVNQTEDRCLEHLRPTDPRDDKTRIERTKGGLLEDSYKWILGHVRLSKMAT